MKSETPVIIQKNLESTCAKPGTKQVKFKISPQKLRIGSQFDLASEQDVFDARIEFQAHCFSN
jgi:hypothetical protein